MVLEMEGWYLPDWSDKKLWARRRENFLINSGNKKSLAEQYPTTESFRDYCYSEAQRTNLNDCNGQNGFCMECSRDPSWDKSAQS